MTATQKFFRYPWAQSGDRATVPDVAPVDGSMGYQGGYGFDYQRAPGDELLKNIERNKFNQLLYDMTLALRQYQTMGFPEFVSPEDNGGAPLAYAKNAFVRWADGQIYVSLVDGNTATPADPSKWQLGFSNGTGSVQWYTCTTAPLDHTEANGSLLLRADYPALWAFAQASGNISVNDATWQKGGYSPGDGSSSFRIPDARGFSPRAWDHGAGIDPGRLLGSVQADATAAHAHGVTDPGHAHTLSDPGHNHTLNDPGHNHAVADPGHAHAVDQTPHGHGVNDPTHGHPYTAALTATPGGAEGGARDAVGQSTQGTAAAATGISIQGANANVAVVGAATGIGIFGAGTGTTNSPATTGASVVGAGTGISTQAAGTGSETRGKNIAWLACIKYR